MIEQELFRSFQRSLKQAGLTSFDRVIVAFSGGLDSSVLVDLFHRSHQYGGPTPELVHIDHGARKNSADDARFCQEEAQKRSLPFHLISLEPKNNRGQKSFRRQRLASLASLAIERGSPAIALGHHADDRLETFLLNSLRGSGLRGLSTMTADTPFPLPGSSLRILRPLIKFSRADLATYATSRNLPWIEDPTNRQDNYARNHLRQNIMPHLLQTEHDRSGLLQTLENLDSEAQALESQAQSLLATARKPSIGPGTIALSRSALARSPAAIIAHLFLSFAPALNAEALSEIYQAITAPPSWQIRYLTKSNCLITITRQTILFEPAFRRGARDLLEQQAAPIRLHPLQSGEAPFFGSQIRWQLITDPGDLPEKSHSSPEQLTISLPANLTPQAPGAPAYIGGPPQPGFDQALDQLFSDHRVHRRLRWRWPCLFDNSHRLLWAPGLPPPLADITPPYWSLIIEPHFSIIKILQPQRN